MLKKVRFWTPAFAGLLLPFCFAPFEMPWLSVLSLLLLLASLQKATPKQATFQVFLFSMIFFSISVSWVFISIHRFGDASVLLAGLLTALFIIYLSILQAGFGWMFAHCRTPWRKTFFFPLGWVSFELLRSYLFTGFPWVLVGTAHVLSPFGALAPIGSVWLVSGAVSLFVSLTYLCLTEKGHTRLIGFFLLITLVILLFMLQNRTHTTPLPHKTVRIALVQPSVPQLLRWDPKQAEQTLVDLKNWSEPYWDTVDWIIWPEGALPIPLPESAPWLLQLANKHPSTQLLTGVPAQSPEGFYYNDVWAVNTPFYYEKQHLVPFGEYVPFESWLRGLITLFDLPMSDFKPGTKIGPLILGDWRVGVVICYETAYPNLVQARAKNADVLLIVSNDAWFGHGLAPAQHLQMAQMRALETGRMVIRATNNGLSAIIDAKGHLVSTLPLDAKGVLLGTIIAYY